MGFVCQKCKGNKQQVDIAKMQGQIGEEIEIEIRVCGLRNFVDYIQCGIETAY